MIRSYFEGMLGMALRDDSSFVSSDDFGKAVLALLQKPALEYSRKLKTSLDLDPKHLEQHEDEIIREMEHFLDTAGVYWDEKIIKKNLKKLVREVLIGLRSVEH